MALTLQTDLKVGRIHWVKVKNLREDLLSQGKIRPAVLVQTATSGSRVLGLTTQPFHKTSGISRVSVPNPNRVGLNRPSHLWGSRLTYVTNVDILEPIGWVDAELVNAIAAHTDISQSAAIDLCIAAALHHKGGI